MRHRIIRWDQQQVGFDHALTNLLWRTSTYAPQNSNVGPTVFPPKTKLLWRISGYAPQNGACCYSEYVFLVDNLRKRIESIVCCKLHYCGCCRRSSMIVIDVLSFM